MTTISSGRYASVNGLQLYYEDHGEGFPLVLIHGGGSTIDSTFGRILPTLARTHRVIAVEMQAHGRTADINRPLSFEQDADDIAALLSLLEIPKADVFGFSNGGTTTLQLAIRHPEKVHKLIIGSALTRRDGMFPGFFDGFDNANLGMLPHGLREAFLSVNSDEKALEAMFYRDVARMKAFADIPDEQVAGIQAPVLIINGDNDVVTREHAVFLSRLMPKAQLAILPGGHGDYIGEIEAVNPNSRLPVLVLDLIETFLNQV